MAWMIDGNKLKEKAVSLLFPTKMESCGHLPEPVQAVTVSTIEDMLYRDGVEVVRCKDCKHSKDIKIVGGTYQKHCKLSYGLPCVEPNNFCSYGERR